MTRRKPMSDFQTIADRVEIEALRGEWANLGGAHLEGASLFGAHLEGVILGGAHLEGARLCRHLVAERLRLEGR
jgi:uncharacterized protein YjbI with pentapeptide repeats